MDAAKREVLERRGYKIAAEREDSRVVFLTQDGELHPFNA